MSRIRLEHATLEELYAAAEALRAATPFDPHKAAYPMCTILVPLELGIRLHAEEIGDYWPTPRKAGDCVGWCSEVRVEVEPVASGQLALFGAPL